MKFLCLAYGDEQGWENLSETDRADALAEDEKLRRRGTLMSAVRPSVVTVTNRDHNLVVTNTSANECRLPLAGFSILEAKDIQEALRLVSNTPCARASGAIEIRELWDLHSNSSANDA